MRPKSGEQAPFSPLVLARNLLIPQSFLWEAEIIINRPLEVVFDFVVHDEAPPQWQSGVIESKIICVNGGTRVTSSVEAEGAGFSKMAEPLVIRMVKRDFQAGFENLKDLLEGGA